MKIVKVLNNSAALVIEGDKESIVMGNGIAFGKKAGEMIKVENIEQRFVAPAEFSLEKFQQLFERISYEDSKLAFEMIQYFKKELDSPLSDAIYLSLTDHISFAIQRAREGIFLPNAVLHEVQMFYPEEYRLGKWAVDLVSKRKKVNLQDDEAGFIALHIINARWKADGEKSEQDFGKIIKDLIAILNETYKIDFSQDGINYYRLVTHLKYFLLRELTMEGIEFKEVSDLNEIIEKYPEAYTGTKKISEYFATFLHHKILKDEKVFLTIHIQRILQNIN